MIHFFKEESSVIFMIRLIMTEINHYIYRYKEIISKDL